MRRLPVTRRPIAGFFLLLAALSGRAVEAEVTAEDFSAHVTLTSDYVYRGLSQSREDPAIQGGFQYRHERGFYAGLWASSVDFPSNRRRSEPRDLEVDYFVGYGFDLSGSWGGSAQLTRYTYPGDDPAFQYDYTELSLTGQFRDLAALSVHLSNDLFGLGERAVAYELTGRAPLGERFEGLAGLGLYDLDKVIGDSYAYWNVGLSWSVGRFVLDLTFIDTSDAASERFGSEVAGGRLVGSVSAHLD